MGARQIATQTCHFCPEGAERHGGSHLTRALSQDRQRQRLNPLVSPALWVLTCQFTHLQQAYSQRGQHIQQAYQTINPLPLPLLNATAAFEAVVRVFDQPAQPRPVYTLPGGFEGRGRYRGQQEPFQRFLSFWSLLAPCRQ